ncbi:C1 family peptidase [Lactobacillus hamsteri]|uniref:Aminopeptidase n=1 Tax=Lactobacillus hamsteri DSM 5661 = JCM 6256 TaxID=1423754 RepID=A0A0R1YF10_9LACO|nr:C1 family peptidase [Lactobacillus hamsteri]KRM40581.1 aminopeptidase e [Lactobacillus hamsteri DSM 5661 = JCM 6256]
MKNQGKEITSDLLDRFSKELKQDKMAAIAGRTIAKNGFLASSADPASSARNNMTFSIEVPTGKATNQRRSGRCWLFAALNTLRQEFAKKYNVKDFELSQNYSFFWDRLGRANLFLQRIVRSAAEELGEQHVQAYLSYAMDDGGEWDNAAAVIEKYGVVPSYVMPDTFNTKNTSEFDTINASLQRKDAIELRQMIKDGKSAEEVENRRQEMLSEIYRLCVLAFGEPPKKFDLEYKDDKGNFHQELDVTPKELLDKFIGVNLDDFVELVDYPDHEYNHVYWNEMQDNVAGGYQTEYVNVDFKYLQQAIIDQLKDGHIVWFGCDVGTDSDARKAGWLDDKLYHQEELIGIDYKMNKKDGLITKQNSATHCMAITGVNLVNGKPNRWKVENSWGDGIGEGGYMCMTQSWFEKYCYQVVANKKYLPKEVLDVLATKPIKVEPWDTLF